MFSLRGQPHRVLRSCTTWHSGASSCTNTGIHESRSLQSLMISSPGMEIAFSGRVMFSPLGQTEHCSALTPCGRSSVRNGNKKCRETMVESQMWRCFQSTLIALVTITVSRVHFFEDLDLVVGNWCKLFAVTLPLPHWARVTVGQYGSNRTVPCALLQNFKSGRSSRTRRNHFCEPHEVATEMAADCFSQLFG